MNGKAFISCGMYTSSNDLKHSWQVFFEHFFPLIETGTELARELIFDAGESVLRDRNLLIGHTCGYPLMTRLLDELTPLCVPLFDVPGTAGKLYSSQIIVPVDSTIDSLEACRGKIVAVNSPDSNSGMNVLRHALAKLGAGPRFFAGVRLTGSHLHSVETVARNRAQLAAIDCVSYQLIAERKPELIAAVRVIGSSTKSCGLPFVVQKHRYTKEQCDCFVAALNQALIETPRKVSEKLHLNRFEAVSLEDYRSIVELEEFAVKAGYPQLN